MPVTVMHERGFTLLELMIVLTIMIVITAAAVPNIMGSNLNRPLIDATNETINMAQYAKNRAVNDFRAYGLQIDVDDSRGGTLRVFRGTGPACGSVSTNGEAVREFEVNSVYRDEDDSGEVQIAMVEIWPNALELLCFTPDGRVVDATTSQPVSSPLSSDYGAGEAVIALQRQVDGVAAGLRHNVLVPYSGRARWTHGDDINSAEGEGVSAQ